MTSDNIKSGVYLAAILGAGFIAWKAYKGAGAIGDTAAKAWGNVAGGAATLGTWVNPASSENLAYRGVNAIGEQITGQADWQLGGAVYETQESRGFTNPWQVFSPSSAGLITKEIGEFFTGKKEPIVSGGGGEFTGRGASGAW